MNTKIKDPLIISLEAYKNGQIHLEGVIEDIQMLMQSPAQSAPLATEGNTLKQEGEQWVWREATGKDFKNEDWEFSHYRYLDGVKLESQYWEVKDGYLQKIGGSGLLPFNKIQILERHPSQTL